MNDSTKPRTLRLWPGVLIVVLQLLALSGPAWLAPMTPAMFYGMLASFTVGTLLLLLGWLFASRARWSNLPARRIPPLALMNPVQ